MLTPVSFGLGQGLPHAVTPSSVNRPNTLARDTVTFSGSRKVPAPKTIAESRYVNERLNFGPDVLQDLSATLDAAMTVAGEAYSGNEAFTTLFHVKMAPAGNRAVEAGRPVNGSVTTQVSHAEKNRMVLETAAKDYSSGYQLAEARATFVAVDPASVGPGKQMKTESVEPLTLKDSEKQLNQDAADWNNKLSGFYKNLSIQLGVRDKDHPAPDLASLASSPNRLVNSNVYVTTDMLNKKRTGHGGIAAAMAVKDMAALAGRFTQGLASVEGLDEFTASYQSPFFESDALQFDTTVDHVDGDEIYLSTRIYRFDTKGYDAARPDERNRTVEGPVILVNGRFKLDKPVSGSLHLADAEAGQRQADALAWAEAVKG